MPDATVPPEHRADIETLWEYLQLHQELRPADVGIGLGSHDPTVPEVAVQLYEKGLFPLIVFTGANAPTTVSRYPRGEAVHYGEHAREHGVPDDAILLETKARYTAENFLLTRELFAARGVSPKSAVVICRPYQERRAANIAAKLWPELDVRCASTNLPLDEYVALIGDVDLVVSMMVGDYYRLYEDPKRGIAIEIEHNEEVWTAYERLAAAGFTARVPHTLSTAENDSDAERP